MMGSNIPEYAAVSVIIVNYNAGELLSDCVESVIGSVREVIVVDNASIDSSIHELIQRFEGESRLRIVNNKRNLGFAAACNVGTREAINPYLLYLNPDSVLEVGGVQTMLYVLESHRDVAMVGGFLSNPDGSEQLGGRRSIPTPGRSFTRAFKLSILAQYFPRLFSDFDLNNQCIPKFPVEVEAISGACMLVKKDVVTEVGLWDEGYFLHCEDLDLCMCFRQKGWKVMYVPDAKVIHQKGACSRSRPIFVEWHKHKGMMRFYRKFFKGQYPGALMWLVALGVWLRFGLVALYHLTSMGMARLGIKRGT